MNGRRDMKKETRNETIIITNQKLNVSLAIYYFATSLLLLFLT